MGRIRMSRVTDASARSLEGFVQSAVVPGSRIHTDGWKVTRDCLPWATPMRSRCCEYWIPRPRRHCCHGASGGIAIETMAAGNSPRGGSSEPPGLLSGRVHLSVQPENLPLPGKTVLPLDPAISSSGAGAVQGHGGRKAAVPSFTPTAWGYCRQLDSPVTLISVRQKTLVFVEK